MTCGNMFFILGIESLYVEPPIDRRFAFAFFSICGFFGFLVWGGINIYNERFRRGAALIASGWLLLGCGLGLYWLSIFPSTWNWWL